MIKIKILLFLVFFFRLGAIQCFTKIMMINYYVNPYIVSIANASMQILLDLSKILTDKFIRPKFNINNSTPLLEESYYNFSKYQNFTKVIRCFLFFLTSNKDRFVNNKQSAGKILVELCPRILTDETMKGLKNRLVEEKIHVSGEQCDDAAVDHFGSIAEGFTHLARIVLGIDRDLRGEQNLSVFFERHGDKVGSVSHVFGLAIHRHLSLLKIKIAQSGGKAFVKDRGQDLTAEFLRHDHTLSCDRVERFAALVFAVFND